MQERKEKKRQKNLKKHIKTLISTPLIHLKRSWWDKYHDTKKCHQLKWVTLVAKDKCVCPSPLGDTCGSLKSLLMIFFDVVEFVSLRYFWWYWWDWNQNFSVSIIFFFSLLFFLLSILYIFLKDVAILNSYKL